jgi:hypothetical protein
MPHRLHNRRRRYGVLTAFVAVMLCVASNLGVAWAAEGVVVLRNGNVLAGRIRQAGQHYFIESEGASLQVPAEQVEMACGSLAEAYEQRRRDRVGASSDAHLELARWCLRNNLLDQAAREVLDARTRDPGHSALASIDTQIRQMLEIDAGRRERAAKAAAGAPLAEAVSDIPASTAPMLTPSPEAQTLFVRSIQPMLIHGCATGGCHQTDSPQQMRLDRWALDGNGNPDRIRRNLEAILTQINAEDPASSPVLLRARQPHGSRNGSRSKALATYQAALLLDWLNEAAGVEPPPPAELEPTAPAVGGETAVPPPAGEGIAIPASPVAATSPTTPVASAVAPPPFTPRDAFDPEIFNRQMAAAQSARLRRPDDAAYSSDEPIPQFADAEGSSESSIATEQLPAAE